MTLCFEAINGKEEIRCEKCNYAFKNKHTLNMHKYTSGKCWLQQPVRALRS